MVTMMQRAMGTAASAARPRPSTLSRPTVPPYRRQRSLSPSPPPLDDGYNGGVCSAVCVRQHRSTGCIMSSCLPRSRTMRFVHHLCISVITTALQAQTQLSRWRRQTHHRLQLLLARDGVREAAPRRQKQRMTMKRCCAALRRQRLAPLQLWPRHTWPAWCSPSSIIPPASQSVASWHRIPHVDKSSKSQTRAAVQSYGQSNGGRQRAMG
jgi:hypothetical protein